MKQARDENKGYLFLIGIFSMTQINVIGWIGISELVLFFLAPIFFIQDRFLLSKHGFSTVVWLSIFMFLGGNVANWFNEIHFRDAVRGVAAPYAIFAIIVCLHHFLWRNIDNMKWLLLGCAISGVISTFIFQPGSDRVVGGEVLTGSEAIQSRIGYSLFWLAQIGSWGLLPIQTLYLVTPALYTYGFGVYLATFSLFSAGGRSSYAILIGSLVLIFLGGKKQAKMKRIKSEFILLCIIGAFSMLLIGGSYKYFAVHGYLGEDQLNKYEKQSQRGTDVLSLLVSGRTGFFAAFFAALDKPLIGHGSWPLDTKGYYLDFLERYGTPEELSEYLASGAGNRKVAYIPGHSQIMVGWTWYGIFGLIFWLYIGYLYFMTLKNNLWVVPQWYGYFCLVLPGGFWGLLFSPFGSRIPSVLLVVLSLFAKALAEKKMVLPEKMQREIFEKAR